MEHYKNMILANVAITNQIYLTTENKNGLMSMKRRDFTDEVLRATVQNMMIHAKRNGRAAFSWKVQDDKKATLAYIPDEILDDFLEWCDSVGYKKSEAEE